MTHQAVLAPQPPMNPPSMATMTHQAPANSYPLTEREPMNPPSMATMTHQTPANSYPLTERERPFACPDCDKAYPTAAGLCARAHPPNVLRRPTTHVQRAALGIVACSPPRPSLVPQTSTSEAPTRTSSTHEAPPGRGPACSKCPAARSWPSLEPSCALAAASAAASAASAGSSSRRQLALSLRPARTRRSRGPPARSGPPSGPGVRVRARARARGLGLGPRRLPSGPAKATFRYGQG